MRWDPYILTQGEQFWRKHLLERSRDLLFITGRGFDIRTQDAPRTIKNCGGQGRRDLLLLCFDNGLPEPEDRAHMTNDNVTQLNHIFGDNCITSIPIQIGGSRQQINTSRRTTHAVPRADDLRMYTDIVIDISAMPRMIAMTVIAKLIRLLDDMLSKNKIDINLHVITSESAVNDHSATGGSLSDIVTNVVGFSGLLNAEASKHLPRVWFPILGERQHARLSLIRQELRPDEICPVIPFPSRDPRRGDQIIDSYRQILFDDFRIEPRNILYACEYNAFEAYKQLYCAIDRYRHTLSELGGCKVFVSPLSSKLLSVAALLACYDHAYGSKKTSSEGRGLSLGISYVESVSYSSPNQDRNIPRELYSLWIRGEWEH